MSVYPGQHLRGPQTGFSRRGGGNQMSLVSYQVALVRNGLRLVCFAQNTLRLNEYVPIYMEGAGQALSSSATLRPHLFMVLMMVMMKLCEIKSQVNY